MEGAAVVGGDASFSVILHPWSNMHSCVDTIECAGQIKGSPLPGLVLVQDHIGTRIPTSFVCLSFKYLSAAFACVRCLNKACLILAWDTQWHS
jgi:hypothetical protein